MHNMESIVYIGEWQLEDLDRILEASRKVDENIPDIKTVVVSLPPCPWDDPDSPQDNKDNITTHQFVHQEGLTSLPVLVVFKSDGSIHAIHSLSVVFDQSAVEESHKSAVHQLLSSGIESFEALDMRSAAKSFYGILRYIPTHRDALYNMSCVLQSATFSFLAMGYLAVLLTANPQDSVAQSLLWLIASNLPVHASTISLYRQLATNDDNIQAKMRLAALTNEGEYASSGYREYISQVFDQLAPTFENKLVCHLQYNVPWILYNLITHQLQQHPTTAVAPMMGKWRIVDLGCGSGLCAKAFHSFFCTSSSPASSQSAIMDNNNHINYSNSLDSVVIEEHTAEAEWLAMAQSQLTVLHNGWMMGIDLSHQMIDIARDLHLYHFLLHKDVLEVLTSLAQRANNTPLHDVSPLRVDLVLSADTFIYIGALGRVFQNVWQILNPAYGLFAFSVEDLEKSSVVGRDVAVEDENCGSLVTAEHCVEWTDGEPVGALGGWGVRLSKSVRYAHSHKYITLLAVRYGFQILQVEREVVRKEEGHAIMGLMYLLQKTVLQEHHVTA